MKKELQSLQKEFSKRIAAAATLVDIDEIEQYFFGRKQGLFTNLMKQMKELSDDVRKEIGQFANEIKQELETALHEQRSILHKAETETRIANERIDITQPLLPERRPGHVHPITSLRYSLEDLFTSMGYRIVDGPELDSEFYNFKAVNIPSDHPARDMQDTFYIKDHPGWVMRTHTSTMQVRAVQQYGAPLRMIAPGRCFRNEATDARHEHTFDQIEGMVVDKNVSFADLKGVLEVVAHHLYGPETNVRLRPKFYPFVEPGVNGEVTCFLCQGNGCRVCKHSGWLEVFGAGMTHPNVLKAAGLDPHEYRAFAFGFGLDRLVMLKYGIEDIRLFRNGDIRFLDQFTYGV